MQFNPRAIEEVQTLIKESPDLPSSLKVQLSDKIEQAKSPLETDKVIYRMVVGTLGLAILACLAFTFFITMKNIDPNVDIQIPEIFLAIGSAAVGALAGLLAPSPGRGSNN